MVGTTTTIMRYEARFPKNCSSCTYITVVRDSHYKKGFIFWLTHMQNIYQYWRGNQILDGLSNHDGLQYKTFSFVSFDNSESIFFTLLVKVVNFYERRAWNIPYLRPWPPEVFFPWESPIQLKHSQSWSNERQNLIPSPLLCMPYSQQQLRCSCFDLVD